MSRHPIQPLVLDPHGVLRFKENKIVRWLVDQIPQALNTIAAMDFSADDRRQLAQLIGYSHSGFGGLSYCDDETYDVAALLYDDPEAKEHEERANHLRAELDALRAALRGPIARLYSIAQEDLVASEDRET